MDSIDLIIDTKGKEDVIRPPCCNLRSDVLGFRDMGGKVGSDSGTQMKLFFFDTEVLGRDPGGCWFDGGCCRRLWRRCPGRY